MKLAFLLFKYFPYGGLQRDFLRIARVCRERGHEIHVYTTEWDGDEEPHFHLHLFPAWGLQNHSRNEAFSAQVKAALLRQPCDLVIGFNKMPNLDIYYAADVCYQTRVREERSPFYRWLPRFRHMVDFERAVFARGKSTKILLISPLQEGEYVSCYQTESDRFHLLPPGITRDRIAPTNAKEIRQAVRHVYQIPADHYLLLMVGSGFKTKGVDRSILALAKLPPEWRAKCHLLIIGEGKREPFLRLAQKHKVDQQVLFLGGRPDVPNFLLAADFLLHPSYHENTGTVLLEAMVSGLPVLTTAKCGYAHYVEKAEAGLVVKTPFVQQEFNQALENALRSAKRPQWHANGIAFSKYADIYHLPEKAADLIEAIGQSRETVSA